MGHRSQASSKEAHDGTCIEFCVFIAGTVEDDDGTDARQLGYDLDRLGVGFAADGDAAGKHFSSYHRVFSAARWSLDALGLAVFGLIEPWLDREAVLLALDDTLARKRGLKMFGTAAISRRRG